MPPASFAPTSAASTNDFWNTTNYVAPPQPVASSVQRGGAGAANPYLDGLTGGEKQAVAAALALETRNEDGTTENSKDFRPLVVVFVLLILGPILLFIGYHDRNAFALLEAEGVQVSGIVMEAWESRGRRGSRSYRLEVAYKTESGESYSDDFSVSRDVFNMHCNSSSIYNPKISLRYARSDPSVARLSSQNDTSSGMITVGMILTVLGVFSSAVSAWWFTRKSA